MNRTLPEIYESPKASKLLIRFVVIAGIFLILIGIVIYRSPAAVPFALGVAVTAGLNVFKLRMLESTVKKVVLTDDIEAGKNTVRLQYLLRYFLTGIVLVAVALINNYTTPPPFYSDRTSYLAVWATLFPNGPESLLSEPLISIWGALAGIFTLQLAVLMIRFMKLEKDGTEFIKYEDEDDDSDVLNENNDPVSFLTDPDDTCDKNIKSTKSDSKTSTIYDINNYVDH